jgi:hypothetical protein
MTPADLSMAGWRYEPSRPNESVCVVDGRPIRAADIRAVLVRIASVTAQDVPVIASEDREYVAAEMTAFLAAWLHALGVAVNPVWPTCLAGRPWRPEQWTLQAASLGIGVEPLDRPMTRAHAPTHVVTVVGGSCFDAVDEVQEIDSLRIASAAGVRLVRLLYADRAFVGADYWSDLDDHRVAAAMAEELAVNRPS